ncbi:hypothetical protein ACWD4V_01120 [Streptomyces tsukubensis]
MRRLVGLGILHRGVVPGTETGRVALTGVSASRGRAAAGDAEGRLFFVGVFGIALLRRRRAGII